MPADSFSESHDIRLRAGCDGARCESCGESLRHANNRITLDTYTQAVTPAKRQAQNKVMKMILRVREDKQERLEHENLLLVLLVPMLFLPLSRKLLRRMAGTTGLEPAASAVTGQRSNQLNYVPTRQKWNCLSHVDRRGGEMATDNSSILAAYCGMENQLRHFAGPQNAMVFIFV